MNITEKLLGVLDSGVWGTIGPYFNSASAELAKLTGSRFGLLCHSAGAAYEAAVRALQAAHGDVMITASYSSPMASLTAVCVGVAPVFCDVEKNSAVTDINSLEKAINICAGKSIRWFAADLSDDMTAEKLTALHEICQKHSVPFILNAGGDFTAQRNKKPLVSFADGVIYSLAEGSSLYTGTGGFFSTDSDDYYSGVFAYHNCGRSPGDACTLNFDAVVGGDLRVTEFTACAASDKAGRGEIVKGVAPKPILMHTQPVFKSEYFRKQTGFCDDIAPLELVNSCNMPLA